MKESLCILLFLGICKISAMETTTEVQLKQNLTSMKESLLILKNKFGILQQKLDLLNVKLNLLPKPAKQELEDFSSALRVNGDIGTFGESVIFTFFNETKISKQPALIWLINKIVSQEDYPIKSLQNSLDKIHRSRVQEILAQKYKGQPVIVYLVNEIAKEQSEKELARYKSILAIILSTLLRSNDLIFIQANLEETLTTIINKIFVNFSAIDFDCQVQIFETFLAKVFMDKPILKNSLIIKAKQLLADVDPKYKDQKDIIEALLN